MTNYEKNKDKIIDFLTGSECRLVARMMGIEDRDCWSVECGECEKELKDWLNAESTEEIDWSKVEQGTEVYANGSLIGRFVAVYNDYIIIDRGAGYNSYPKEMCRLEK